MTSIGACGRSIMLKTDVYTVSQPCGVWKFVAPRSETPPAGVPRSSGTMNARASSIAVSAGIGCSLLMNVICSRTMPTLPIGSCMSSEKIASPCPPGAVRKYVS
jgi:hypothetical protein